MKATLYKATGEVIDVKPADGKSFTLEELRAFVGGIVQMVTLPTTKRIFICNDNGAIDGLLSNPNAFKEWDNEFPVAEFPHNNVSMVYGDILISDAKFVE